MIAYESSFKFFFAVSLLSINKTTWHLLHCVFNTFTLFWSRKMSVVVETFHLSFLVFVCAFHLDTSTFFCQKFSLFSFSMFWVRHHNQPYLIHLLVSLKLAILTYVLGYFCLEWHHWVLKNYLFLRLPNLPVINFNLCSAKLCLLWL